MNFDKLADKVASTGILADNLLEAGFEDAAAVAVRNMDSFDPTEFRKLLASKQFYLAREWIRADRDEH